VRLEISAKTIGARLYQPATSEARELRISSPFRPQLVNEAPWRSVVPVAYAAVPSGTPAGTRRVCGTVARTVLLAVLACEDADDAEVLIDALIFGERFGGQKNVASAGSAARLGVPDRGLA
jgi:hypothetical protein